MSPSCTEAGDSTSAMTNSTSCSIVLTKPLRKPPAATAEASGTPCFCRYRIWSATPPIPGIARFENDIASSVSVVASSGKRIGTVPSRAIAYAKFVASDKASASSASHQFALRIVSHIFCGLPT